MAQAGMKSLILGQKMGVVTEHRTNAPWFDVEMDTPVIYDWKMEKVVGVVFSEKQVKTCMYIVFTYCSTNIALHTIANLVA